MSYTYLATLLLATLGVENADNVATAIVTVGTALFVLYRRYKAGDLHWTGFRK
jgi:hypothetical protein